MIFEKSLENIIGTHDLLEVFISFPEFEGW